MNRVGVWLTRGIVVGAVLLGGGALSDTVPSRLSRALDLVHRQDFSPLFDVAGRRVSDSFETKRIEAFLGELFGLSGKWRAVTRSRDAYERYVRRSFEEKVFGPRDLDRILGQIRADYDYQIAASENRLLVGLYDDLRISRPGLSFESFRAEYAGLAASLSPCVVRDLGMNLVSFAGSDSAAVLLVAALSSAGILGTSVAGGAAGGPMTFGVSVAAGLIAGVVLDAIVGEAFEDAARMEVRAYVSELRNRLIDAVHDALVQAILAYVSLEERCVIAMYSGGAIERVGARP